MTCDAFDVIVVPFPFTETARAVTRPALIVSRRVFNEHGYSVLAMITDCRNEPWALDAPVDHASAGLKMPSVVRMKLFTLDNRLILRRIGQIPRPDRAAVLLSLRDLLPCAEV